ncbi:MAG: TGS domain-containing protein [bacterium]
MPATVSPEYKKAEEAYRKAQTPDERLAGLEEMLATIPKHKGTEKMQADIKTRIAKLRREFATKKGPRRQDSLHIEKQGAGQVAVFGAPNCGKSALVAGLTGLPTQVAPWPFTTTQPGAGMMPWEGIQIQLIDTPPIAPDAPGWLYHIIRTADVGLWVLDLADDALLETTEQVQQLLAAARISLLPSEELRHCQTIKVGAKCDDPAADDRLAILAELLGSADILPVSIETGAGIEELKRRLFAILDIIRVYTKRPGHPVDKVDPVILPTGATVMDAAYHLHKDIARQLNFARLWSEPDIEGLRVEREHVLKDRDVVEFHL